MGEASSGPSGPDLRVGVPLSDLAEGAMLLGHVGDESVLVARVGEELFAIANLPHVHTLRTLADSRRIIADADKKRRAVVVGASFIGLEAAASLRERGLEVHVVAPDERPLARVMGTEIGDFVRGVHEEHGVRFHLQTKPVTIDAGEVTLENGERIQADLVVVGGTASRSSAISRRATRARHSSRGACDSPSSRSVATAKRSRRSCAWRPTRAVRDPGREPRPCRRA